MRVVIAAILRAYGVAAAEQEAEHAMRRAITITPKDGARVALRARRPAVEPAAALAA